MHGKLRKIQPTYFAHNAAEIERVATSTLFAGPITYDHHVFKHLDHFVKEKVFQNEASNKSAFDGFAASKDSGFDQMSINMLVTRWKNVYSIKWILF